MHRVTEGRSRLQVANSKGSCEIATAMLYQEPHSTNVFEHVQPIPLYWVGACWKLGGRTLAHHVTHLFESISWLNKAIS